MNRRPALFPLALCALLTACGSDPVAPPPAPTTVPVAPAAEPEPPASHHPSLRGELLGVAAGADVELALLVVDARGRPGQLLGSLQLRGDGSPLRFALPFAPEAFPLDRRVELRGRVSQSGRLVQRLLPRTISQPLSQELGALPLVSAP